MALHPGPRHARSAAIRCPVLPTTLSTSSLTHWVRVRQQNPCAGASSPGLTPYSPLPDLHKPQKYPGVPAWRIRLISRATPGTRKLPTTLPLDSILETVITPNYPEQNLYF